MKITEARIKELLKNPPEKKRAYIRDTSQNHFYIFVYQGKKGTTVNYLHLSKRVGKKSIGRYPEVSLREARQRCREIYLESQPRRKGQTLLSVVEKWLESEEARWSPATLKQYKRLPRVLERTPLARMAIEKISKSDIYDAIKLKARTAPTEARSEYWMLTQVFKFAYRQEIIDSDPMGRISKRDFAEFVSLQPRERVLSKTELQRLLIIAKDYTVVKRVWIWFLVLTGCRTEIRNAKWSGWDQKQATLTYQAKGKGQGQPFFHTLPLTQILSGRLSRLPQDHEKIFRGLGDPADLLALVRPRVNVLHRWVWHDLRRSHWTGIAGLGCPPHIVKRIRGDSVDRIEATYNRHQYLEEAREWLNRWSGHLLHREHKYSPEFGRATEAGHIEDIEKGQV